MVSVTTDSQLAEQRHPSRAELDQVSADTPVLIVHQSAHFGVLNSAALKKIGITADSPNPPGGVIVKDPKTGEPTGLLEENAFFMALGKLFPKMNGEQAVAMLKEGERLYTRFGYTTLQDGRSSPQHVKVAMGAAPGRRAESGYRVLPGYSQRGCGRIDGAAVLPQRGQHTAVP